MPDKIRTLIIDDEELARSVIKSFLDDHAELELVGECANGFEGLKMIQEENPDLIFLDIKMPKITGFEMLELMDQWPVIIFSTAYDQYAIKAFELNAADYLLKPYNRSRFDDAVQKAKVKIRSQEDQTRHIENLVEYTQSIEKLTRIVVKVGSKIHILSLDDIRFIEAMDDYVGIHTNQGRFLKQHT